MMRNRSSPGQVPWISARRRWCAQQAQLTHSPASVGAAKCIWHHRPWIVSINHEGGRGSPANALSLSANTLLTQTGSCPEPSARFHWHVTVPVNVPETSYSRDVIAVVSGATGTSLSSLPTTVKTQPSGASNTPGGPDGTAPLCGDGARGGAGLAADGTEWSGGGSADASGAAPNGISMQTAARVA